MIKSIFVSTFITAGLAGLVVSVLRLIDQGWSSPWFGTAIACAAPVVFFAGVYIVSTPRTSRNLHLMLAGGVIGTVLSFAFAGTPMAPAVLVAAGVGILGVILYVYWYSRFEPRATELRTGGKLPAFELREKGQPVSSSQLVAKPALWIFYRGNWCPLCMAQIKEVAGQYRELARRGVDVFLISPQPERNSEALSAKFDAPMRFMTDTDNAAAKILGICEPAGLPAGMQVLGYQSDVPRPTVFITAAGGELIYCDLTDNYRVRPEPAEFLAVLDRHAIA